MSFYKTPEWQALRQRALARAKYRCEWCQKSVRGKGAARVDHIATVRERWDLRASMSNLRVLCPQCDGARHAEKGHAKGWVDVRGADIDGMPTSPAHHWNKPR